MKTLLKTLSSLNVKLEVQDGKLRVNAPAGVLTAQLQAQIREHRDGLLELLVQPREHEEAPLPQIVPDLENRHAPFPLNDVQYAYWIGRQAHFDLGNVSTHFYFEVDAESIDLQRLAKAFNKVVAQQDMLRAVTDADGQQRILPEVPFYAIDEDDLTELDDAGRDAVLAQTRATLSQRQIASDSWPLFKVTAARTSPTKTRLFFSWDFIFLDAWSILLIFKEWQQCYEDASRVPPALTLSFRDYVLAEARLKELPAYRRARDYWWKRIDTLPEAPMLPLAAQKGEVGRHAFTRRRFELPAADWQALKAHASKRGITPSSLLLASFSEILNAWSKNPHYCLNLTVFNRQPLHEEVNAVVGDFTNLIVLEVDGRQGDNFVERALRLQDQFLRDYDHREVSAVEVLREMAKRRGAQGEALLPVVFTSTLMLNGSRSDDSAGLERFGPMVWGISQTPQVWLDYQIFEVGGSLVFNWDAVDAMFEPGVLDAMFDTNRALVEALAKSEAAWELSSPVSLPRAQMARRREANASTAAMPETCLHEDFVLQALRRPDAIALSCGERNMCYGELLSRSHALADELLRRGAAPGELVAVVMDKGWEQVAAVMAILIAGCAYLPLDPRWPALRRSGIMARCDTRFALVRPNESNTLDLPVGVQALEVTDGGSWSPLTQAPALRQTLDSLAYVIFTSGSTGEPKGVVIDHRGAVNTVMHINRLFGVGQKDKALGVSELGFDLSVYDIFGILGAGGTLVVPSGAMAREPQHWVDLVRAHGITVWNSAPQLMVLLADTAEAREEKLPALRLAMLSGDWIPTRLPDRIRALSGRAEVVSLGGATEGSIWSIYYPIGEVDPSWPSIPYGKALPNQSMYVLDKRLAIRPDLAVGDIYIGGTGVALGYWKDEEKTAQRFMRHPATGEKLYWTGDLGRYLPDGNIEFLGREDTQVKLRGYRVELGEIAAALQSHASVRDAAVQVLKIDGRQVLAAWMVGDAGDAALAPAALAAWLRERLPEYMVPQRFTACASFPLSANGKVDLKRLPVEALAANAVPRAASGPVSPMQARILAVWEEVLGVQGLGIRDNFFEAGGDSLLLTSVLRKLNPGSSRQLTIADMFSYPTVQALAGYLDDGQAPAPAVAAGSVARGGDIAIIGMAGRFPDAADTAALWKMLQDGHCAVRQFSDEELLAAHVDPEELRQPNYVKAGPVLQGMDQFDASYFGMSPAEAAFTDPQQRFLLECAVEALDDAGYPSEEQAGRIGVMVGKGTPRYMVDHVLHSQEAMATFGRFTILNGHDKDHAATYLSYKLNLTGPSVSVNTSCSTSLVAVHMACQQLRDGECEIALAGGVSFMSTLEREGYLYVDGHITSPDGICRAFSDDAAGVVFGSGVGMVVLKPLDAALRDRDTIHAVIKGSAINNDGARKVGYTAPSTHGQARAIAEALGMAGMSPDRVGLIEAHGTGTSLGDPIEVAALRQVFGDARADGSHIALGSIKSNLGHLDVAAGVTGLIKATLAVRDGQLPPTLHVSSPNARIDFAGSPFKLNTALRPWPVQDAPRVAGVSSFGVGGTNAHIVLEQAPPGAARNADDAAQLLVVSARSEAALARAAERLACHLDANPDLQLADVAMTLQQGRTAHRYRRHVVANSAQATVAQLRKPAPFAPKSVPDGGAARVAFLFPGQGAQKAGSTRSLYQNSAAFRSAFDQCAQLVETFCSIDLRTELYGESADAIDRTEVTQPLMFALEYALAQHWMSLGVRPAAMAGHSLGEYVAACLAGVFSLEEAMSLVVVRGQLMASLPAGAMLAVSAPEPDLQPLLLAHGCDLAASNGPEQCVASGTFEAIDALRAALEERDIPSKLLRTSHAFHSAMLDSIVETFEACVGETERSEPAIPFVSCLTGDWIKPGEATSPRYWARHMRETVRFGDAVQRLDAQTCEMLLEVGPGRTLSALARHAGIPGERCIPSLDHEHGEEQALLHSLGRMWAQGAAFDWKLAGPAGASRISLPSYPFEHKRHWIPYGRRHAASLMPAAPVSEPVSVNVQNTPATPGGTPMNEVETRLAAIWREFLGVDHIDVHDNFFELGGDSLMATRVYARIRHEFGVELPRQKLFELATIKRLYLFIVTSKDIDAVERLSEEELNEFQALIES